jgi:hypothetical protein
MCGWMPAPNGQSACGLQGLLAPSEIRVNPGAWQSVGRLLQQLFFSEVREASEEK